MQPAGLEPTISADERPQTYALDRVATGTGTGKDIWPTKTKMAREYEVMVNCRLCTENQIFNNIESKKTRRGWSTEWWWGHKESTSGEKKQMEEEKQEDQN